MANGKHSMVGDAATLTKEAHKHDGACGISRDSTVDNSEGSTVVDASAVTSKTVADRTIVRDGALAEDEASRIIDPTARAELLARVISKDGGFADGQGPCVVDTAAQASHVA